MDLPQRILSETLTCHLRFQSRGLRINFRRSPDHHMYGGNTSLASAISICSDMIFCVSDLVQEQLCESGQAPRDLPPS